MCVWGGVSGVLFYCYLISRREGKPGRVRSDRPLPSICLVYSAVYIYYMCVVTVLPVRRRRLSWGVFIGMPEAGGKCIMCPVR